MNNEVGPNQSFKMKIIVMIIVLIIGLRIILSLELGEIIITSH